MCTGQRRAKLRELNEFTERTGDKKLVISHKCVQTIEAQPRVEIDSRME